MSLLTPTVIIREQLYDSLGRPAVRTIKVARGETGLQGDESAVWSFVPNFITTRDPNQSTASWVTGGPLDSASLVTQWVDPTSFMAADAPYPYSGRYFEKDSVSRLLQTSLPGSIFKVPQSTGDTDYTTHLDDGFLPSSLSIFKDEGPSIFSLPQTLAGSQLRLNATQNYLGSMGSLTRAKVQDFLNRPIISLTLPDSTTFLMTSYQYQVGAQGGSLQPSLMQVTTQQLPNYYGLNATSQTVQTSFTSLGQPVITQDVDSGLTNRFYDVYGRLRFTQNADQANSANRNDTIIYYLYDALNRLIEKGLLNNVGWKLASLQAVNDSIDASHLPMDQFPEASAHPLRQWLYDQLPGVTANTAELSTQGKLVLINSWNTTTVEDSWTIKVLAHSRLTTQYTYDSLGRPISITLSDSQKATYTTQYTYDATNRNVSITYPSTQTLVYTNYNLQGKTKGIGTAADYQTTPSHASYQYNATGHVITEYLGSYNQALYYAYQNTLFQLTRLSDFHQFMTIDLSYTDASGHYQDGNIQQAFYFFSPDVAVNGETAKQHFYKYTYDVFNRLTNASGYLYKNNDPLQRRWSLTEVNFDANGNITAAIADEIPWTYQWESTGSNQLQVMQNTKYEQMQSFYTPGGLVYYTAHFGTWIENQKIYSLSSITNFIYDTLLNLPTQTQQWQENQLGEETPITTINFLYDAQGERYQKQVVNGTTYTYLRGFGASPLVELNNGQATEYIYGPTGLILINTQNTINIVLKDHQGSIRIIHTDEESPTVQAYFNYLPYGGIMNDNSTLGQVTNYRYLYTGQEWDEELQLYNYHARQYEPYHLRRFLTPDPGHQFSSPYLFAGNNPINYLDLTGAITWTIHDLALKNVREILQAGIVTADNFAYMHGVLIISYQGINPPISFEHTLILVGQPLENGTSDWVQSTEHSGANRLEWGRAEPDFTGAILPLGGKAPPIHRSAFHSETLVQELLTEKKLMNNWGEQLTSKAGTALGFSVRLRKGTNNNGYIMDISPGYFMDEAPTRSYLERKGWTSRSLNAREDMKKKENYDNYYKSEGSFGMDEFTGKPLPEDQAHIIEALHQFSAEFNAQPNGDFHVRFEDSDP